MKVADLTVEVRDKNLNRLGQVVAADLDLLLEDQFNNVGSWSLKLATNHPLAGALRTPGAGIIVTRSDGTSLLSGPTIKPEDAATSTDPGGTLTVEGVTDTVILADRIAYPDPTNVNPQTQTLSHDVRTGPIETLMHAYVNANFGPGAPSARRDTRLQMGTNLGRGSAVTKKARFPVIGDLLAELAITAGLGFRVVQVGSKLEFQTYAISNRVTEIRLDITNNTLAGHRVATAPPGVTRVIVAGQGELVNRKFVALDTPESIAAEVEWGRRIEKFVDQRQTNDNTELSQAGMEALAKDGFSQLSVQVVPMEDSSMQFGRDWGLGDRVAVVVGGAEVTCDVTGYALRANVDGLKLGAILGEPSLAQATSPIQQLSQVTSRVSNLERNAEATNTTALDNRVTAVEASTTSLDSRATALDSRTTAVEGSLPSALPMTGEVRMWAGASAPSGWALCDGASVNRTGTYANLFAVIGTAYGAPSGTTFNLPNIKGRVPVGLDAAQTEFNALGKTGGAKTHVLAQTEMPSHTHTDAGHVHDQVVTNPVPGGSQGRADFDSDAVVGVYAQGVATASASANIQATGGGAAHNNLQPYVALNFIIKF